MQIQSTKHAEKVTTVADVSMFKSGIHVNEY